MTLTMSSSIPIPNSSPQIHHYSLNVIKFEDTASGAKTASLYVKVKLGDDTNGQQTSTVRGLSPSWGTKFTFSSSDTSTRFSIRVKRKRTSCFRVFEKSNPCLGLIEISIADLLEKCSQTPDNSVRINLHPSSGVPGPSKGTGVLYLNLERIDKITNVRANIGSAIDAIRQRGIARSAIGEKFSTIGDISSESQLEGQSDLYQYLYTLCKKIGIFADIVDKLAVAHPYLNAAWQVASSLFRVIEKKFENDQMIVELVCTASEAFDFACEVEELPNKVESLQNLIISLLRQTTELYIFVRHYISQRLAGQLLTLHDNAAKIKEFKDYFRMIKDELIAPLALQTAFVSARMSETLDIIHLEQELKPDEKSATGRPECLPGTRGEYLNTIMDWAFSDSDQNIFWLYGVAGSGKSTISMTIAEQSLSMLRRGAYMYFERGKSDPNSVIRSIAFWLASFDYSIGKHISKAVKAYNGIAKASLIRQFEVLLLQPLRAAEADIVGPIIIILDALDECGPLGARRELVQLLAKRFPELPRNFRFIITSRQEEDIESAFSRETSIRRVKLDHESAASRRDVYTYFVHEMDALFAKPEVKRSLPVDWPWDANMRLLGETASGLFVWASTGVKYITEFVVIAFQRLDKLVRDVQSRGHGEFGLDHLYSSILLTAPIPWDDTETRLQFSNILYLILEVPIVLSTDDIDGILDLPPHSTSTLIISQLQSVLSYTPGSTSRIRPLHASFAEFLRSPKQVKKPWHIDVTNKREYISKRCHESFDRMNRMLRFNICEIETSFAFNDCIPGLQSRIKKNISPELENACVYWIQQLRILPHSPEILSKLDYFLHTHLLSWLEVLSLKGKVDLAISVLVGAYKWVVGHSTSLESFLRDARKLIMAFYTPISKSLPHIYLSMLSLAWPNSEVAIHYSRAITSPSKVEVIGNRSQRVPLSVFEGHTDIVSCISYSLDGKYIVSGSYDTVVIVWDAESGEVVAGPFKGHTSVVNSVGFSRDGKYVVSGSSDKLVIVWYVESGEMVDQFEGHTSWINCVSFSPDGKHVVSGSSDSTVRVWEVESDNGISATFEGHSSEVRTVAFSSDGNFIVSGSDDRTLIVWNSQSGEIVKGPLKGHTDWVFSAMFSRDGKRIVSGSDTIGVWDLESGELVAGPFTKHSSTVISLTFSDDGRYIFSSSWDNTMKVWDVKSGKIVSNVVGHAVYSAAFSSDGTRVASGSVNGTIQVFDVQVDSEVFDEGHTDAINCVAYSPDGKHIVSASNDKTIIVWDVESGKIVAGPFKRHLDVVNSATYSSDGKRIVSGSWDHTVIVWDADTGEVISGPLKGHNFWVMSAVFLPDGKRVVSGSGDQMLIMWDVESGSIIWGPLHAHSGMLAAGLSPDGRYIVSWGFDDVIRVWVAESGEAKLGPLKGHTNGINYAAYSPDGRYIVSGSRDRTIRLWNADNGEAIGSPFTGHTDELHCVSFSPDGKHIISSSADRTVGVWNVDNGKPLVGPFKGHTNMIRSISASPDGKYIASGAFDGIIRVWDVGNEVLPQPTASKYANWVLSEDGWILGQEGELLLWIPLDMRASLWHPANFAVFGSQFSTKLHFTERGIGENWKGCFEPQKLFIK